MSCATTGVWAPGRGRCKNRPARLLFNGLNVFDDEQLFARLDEAEVAARDLFNRGRIVGKPARLVAQACVFGALAGDRPGELVIFVARSQHRQQSAFADQAVDDNQRRDEQEQPANDLLVAAWTRCGCYFAAGFGFRVLPGHDWPRQYNNFDQSTRGDVTDLVIVLTTITDERADEVASSLVTERLAACVNVHGPMRSVYRWKGAVETEPERQLVIKTTASRLDALQARLAAIHPYELPEFVVIRPERASRGYEEWVRAETATPASGGA